MGLPIGKWETLLNRMGLTNGINKMQKRVSDEKAKELFKKPMLLNLQNVL
jgi:hypothetical protein